MGKLWNLMNGRTEERAKEIRSAKKTRKSESKWQKQKKGKKRK